MKTFYKKLLLILTTIILSISFTACSALTNNSGSKSNNNGSSSSDSTGGTTVDIYDESDMFSNRDKNIEYDETSATTIALLNNGTTITGSGATVSNNVVTISSAGTYILSGTLTNGQIIVNATSDDKLQLVLDNINVNCNTSAPLYIKTADKVFVTLADGSKNTLTNKNDFVDIDENSIDAVMFSKEDTTFNGNGTLNVTAVYGHGFVSKDDLVFTSGTYIVNAKKSAFNGKDCVKIANGTFNLTSGTDGIHSENSDDTSLGYIYISNGDFTINSTSDGIDANSYLQIIGGTFDIDSTGKGIKATSNIVLNNGDIDITATDDSVHSNGTININNGTLTLSTGDDGVHADENVKIAGGTINITKSYEGIEGKTIDINGGNISIVASDDGLNAAGGNDQSGFGGFNPGGEQFSSASSSYYLSIAGGVLNVNASGDGVDSNGNLYVTGGETYVSGPTNGGNGAVDYGENCSATISGGIFIAVGTSDMAENFTNATNQGAILVNFNSSTNSLVSIKDSSNNVLASFTPAKKYNSVVISCPGITTGNTYTLTACNQSTSITMSSLIYGSNSQGGGSQGGGGFQPPSRR